MFPYQFHFVITFFFVVNFFIVYTLFICTNGNLIISSLIIRIIIYIFIICRWVWGNLIIRLLIIRIIIHIFTIIWCLRVILIIIALIIRRSINIYTIIWCLGGILIIISSSSLSVASISSSIDEWNFFHPHIRVLFNSLEDIDEIYQVITLILKKKVIYPSIWRIMHHSRYPRFLQLFYINNH